MKELSLGRVLAMSVLLAGVTASGCLTVAELAIEDR